MKMKRLVSLILLCVFFSCEAEVKNEVKMHISEHGANYIQTVSYDPEFDIVKIHNPQHLHLDESITLLHKKSGLRMVLDTHTNICDLDNIPDYVDPDLLLEDSLEEENTTMTPEISVDIQQAVIHLGEITVNRRKSLPPPMQDLCKHATIYHSHKIELDEAIIETMHNSNGTDITTFVNFPVLGGRVKRDIFMDDFVTCTGGTSDKCTMRAWGNYCTWYICPNRGTRPAMCSNRFAVHEGDNVWRCALCCETSSQPRMCKCSDIHNQSTFAKCQKKNRPKNG